jgi:hypothetical protein
MIGRITVYQLDSDLCMAPVIGAQQVREETRRERREYPDLDPTIFGTPDRGDVFRTVLDLAKGLSRVLHEALPGQRQKNTSIVSLK